MVVHSDEQNRRRDELEMRIAKMISEGGMAVDAHYFNDQSLADSQDEMEKVELAKTKMMDEGGLGSADYYNRTKDIHDVDVEKDNQLMN